MDEMKLIDLPMLSDEEYNKVVYDFNNTAVDYPRDKCVHELFEEQVKKTPDTIALCYGTAEFTFREVNELANFLANELIKRGVAKGDIVALVMKRSYYIPICIIAVLKTGAAYLPVDPSYPSERIEDIIKDAKCKVTLTYNVSISFENSIDICELNLSYSDDINLSISSENVCIVIFTSGSTGKPKGTLLTHKGLVNYAYANHALYDGGSCVIGLSIYTFDAFFLDCILPMMLGKRAVMATEKEQFSQDDFERIIKTNPYCNFFITPTKLLNFINNSIDDDFLNHVNKICIGGEVFPSEILNKINKNVKLFNVYGPSECSMWVSEYPVVSEHMTLSVTPPPRIIRRNINQRLECPLAS